MNAVETLSSCTLHWRIQLGASASWSNFFHFHAVFRKNLAKYRLGPPWELVPPVWEILGPSLLLRKMAQWKLYERWESKTVNILLERLQHYFRCLVINKNWGEFYKVRANLACEHNTFAFWMWTIKISLLKAYWELDLSQIIWWTVKSKQNSFKWIKLYVYFIIRKNKGTNLYKA